MYFGVPCITLWYPKIIVLKSMIFRLSNAVSDTFFAFPIAFLQCYEVWSFFGFFEEKCAFWIVPWNWIKSWMFQILYALIQESYEFEDDRYGVGKRNCFNLLFGQFKWGGATLYFDLNGLSMVIWKYYNSRFTMKTP